MSTESGVTILRSELAQIVESVFATMLRLDAVECGAPVLAGGDRLTASVYLSGKWNGAVLLECDRRQACLIAGRFLSTDPPDMVNDLVRDVLGELANMIGGNLKSVLAQGIELSMPTVVDGRDYCLRIVGAGVLERLVLECADGLFWVTVLGTRS
jgi:chemotaxis protein CheX